MEVRNLLLLILFQVFVAKGNSAFPPSAYFTMKENKRLQGHVIKRFDSPSLPSCSHVCMKTEWCTSTNFQTSKKDGKGTCELNKHGISLVDENAIFDEEGVTFSMFFKHPCQKNPCQNNGACVPGHLAGKTYHCVCKPGFAGTHCEACKFDFEDGIDGWEKTGTVFNNQPTYGDNPTARQRQQPANQQGDWWIGGAEDRPCICASAGYIQGDHRQGTLLSPSFTIMEQNISFLIGGGCDVDSVRAELLINGQPVRNETGDCTETMILKTWDVAAFIGQRARVRLVDFSSDEWGHINFDDLKGDISCESG